MAFQFAHIATYSRKGNGLGRTVSDIAAEAARLDGHAPHVEQPQPPIRHYGIDPAEIPAEIERLVAERRAALRGTKRAAIRRDTHVLEGMVYSHPAYCRPTPDEHTGEPRPCLTDPATRLDYAAWRDSTMSWARESAEHRGLRVLSIVEHLDEAHPHIHVLSLPLNDRMDAKQTHPGHFAKIEALAAGKDQKAGNLAYRAAMRTWQDTYHDDVGMPHGLTRIGPRKRRLTRAEWQIEHTEAVRTAARLRAAEKAEAEAAVIIAAAQETARHALAEADRQAGLIEAAARKRAERQAKDIVADAVAKADQVEKAIHHKEAVLSAKIEGIDAWGDGRLIGPAPGRPDGRRDLKFSDPAEAKSSGLIERIKPAWDWLHDWTVSANHAVQRQINVRLPNAIADARDAVVTAARSWAEGLIWHRGKNRQDGSSTIRDNPARQTEAGPIIRSLEPYREIIADMLDRLPDREAIHEAERLAADLAPFVDQIQRDKAHQVVTTIRKPAEPTL